MINRVELDKHCFFLPSSSIHLLSYIYIYNSKFGIRNRIDIEEKLMIIRCKKKL